MTNEPIKNDMSLARAAKDPTKKPAGRPNEAERIDAIHDVQELWLNGYSCHEIAMMRNHSDVTVKKYVSDLADLRRERAKDSIDDKITRAVANLRHLAARADTVVDGRNPAKAIELQRTIEMNIAELEGLLKNNVNFTGSMTLTDLIKMANTHDAGS